MLTQEAMIMMGQVQEVFEASPAIDHSTLSIRNQPKTKALLSASQWQGVKKWDDKACHPVDKISYT